MDSRTRPTEVAPVAVFLPGQLVGASGRVDAKLAFRDLDPATAHVRGTLAVRSGRIPLAPVIGTLRDANATFAITDDGITAKLDGKIGPGKITAKANTGLDAREAEVSAVLS